MKLYKYLFLIVLFILPLFLKAQNITIKGKVVDKDKQGISGATIIVNTKIGTVTDAEGLFSLEVPSKHINEILLVQAVDFLDQKFQISDILDKKDWEICLEEDTAEICRVVVTCICEVRVPEKDRIKDLTFWERIKEKVKR